MKRGETGELHYYFDASSNCEVGLKGEWYRTTPRQFRSWDGPRRLNGEDYDGPLFYFKTNMVTDYRGTEETVYAVNVTYTPSLQREWENFE
jgi:hypothetical protein